LAEQDPAPQLPSLAGFFFLVDVAAGFVSVFASVAAAGVEVVVAVEFAAGVGVVVVVDGVVAAAGVGVAAVLVALSVVVAAPAAGAAPVVAAGELAGGVEPPHAATPKAAAANPKILFLSVMSIPSLPFVVPTGGICVPLIAPLSPWLLRCAALGGFGGAPRFAICRAILFACQV
jgi:hypothetical protein